MSELKINFDLLTAPSVSLENEFELDDKVKARVGVPIDNCPEVDTYEAMVSELDEVLEKRETFVRDTVKISLENN